MGIGSGDLDINEFAEALRLFGANMRREQARCSVRACACVPVRMREVELRLDHAPTASAHGCEVCSALRSALRALLAACRS